MFLKRVSAIPCTPLAVQPPKGRLQPRFSSPRLLPYAAAAWKCSAAHPARQEITKGTEHEQKENGTLTPLPFLPLFNRLVGLSCYMPENRTIPVEELRRFVTKTFTGLDVPLADAEICADVIVSADLFGRESHGISRLKYYCERISDGIQNPVTSLDVLRETDTTAVIDGNNGMGQVIAHQAMSVAIDKAVQRGFGCVAVKNSSHFGIAGYYSLMCVEKDLIGITFTNARPAVAPTNSCEPVLGTNPYAIGIPSDESFPFLIDCATSVLQRGNFEVFQRQTDSVYVKDSVIFSEEKEDYCHPTEVLDQLKSAQAALRTIGGHKGYGLSVAIEIFCSALQSGDFLRQLSGFYEGGKKKPYNVGHFFLAINPANFIEVEAFKKNVGDVMRQLKESKPVGEEKVLVSGEKEYFSREEKLKEGISVDPVLMEELECLGLSYDR